MKDAEDATLLHMVYFQAIKLQEIWQGEKALYSIGYQYYGTMEAWQYWTVSFTCRGVFSCRKSVHGNEALAVFLVLITDSPWKNRPLFAARLSPEPRASLDVPQLC